MEIRQIWQRIEARLDELGLSVNAASKQLGMDLRNIQRAAKSPSRGVSSKTLARVATGLKLSLHDLPNETGGGSGGGDDQEIADLRRRGNELLAIAAYLEERKKIR